MKKIIIIGGGILGLSTAYELSNENAQITVIDAIYEGAATKAGAGIICPWTTQRRNLNWYLLAKNGANYYPEFIKKIEKDNELSHGYAKVGALVLDNDLDKLNTIYERVMARKQTAPEIGTVKILNSSETTKHFSLLNNKYHSIYISGGARIDGRKLQNSLINAAKKNGVNFITGTAKLHQVEQEKPQLDVNNTTLSYDKLIVTTGAWINEFFTPLDLELRTTFQKGQIAHLQSDGIDTANMPVIMPPNNQYILGFPDNKLVVGATKEPINIKNAQATTAGKNEIITKASDIIPEINHFSIEDIRVGFRPNTFNRLPVFGKIKDFNNIIIATGLGASGLTTGPFIGKLISQITLNKKTDIDITPYFTEQIIKRKD